MRSQFRMLQLPFVDCPDTLMAENTAVTNVLEAFGAIHSVGDPLAARDGDVFPVYAYTGAEIRGVNAPGNHFRGVQRIRKGPYLVVSGGLGTGRRRSQVFIVKMGTRAARGPWGSNLVKNAIPGTTDRVISCYGIDTFRWRAGGISRLGDLIAVPIEGRRKSRVVFLHAKNPEALERLKVEIDRSGVPSAEAAAVERLPDGRFVVGVWRELRGNYPGRLDLYVSRDERLRNGFEERPFAWTFNGFGDESDRSPRYRNINFITERRVAGQVQLYMIGTENTSRSAPAENGVNVADLWRVNLPNGLVAGRSPSGRFRLDHVATREYHGVRDHANFGAGAGTYVDDVGALHMYSCFHWRVERTVRMTEYASHRPGTIHDLRDAWVELYEHDGFRGKRLSIYGNRHAEITDYRRIFVDNGDFNDAVSSVKYQIPRGHAYRLYRDAGFKERRTLKKPFVDLVGTGSAVAIPDLKERPLRFGDKVSSSKYVVRDGSRS